FEGSDACVAPVLTFSEAAHHPHVAARETFVSPGGVQQSSKAPRFSRSVPDVVQPPTPAGGDTVEVLAELGLSPDEIASATKKAP
ncbi:MAG: CoA transferase, partial [Sulfitobacter sp.]|nr:CoA transferase [Sulfitobacter sp.]